MKKYLRNAFFGFAVASITAYNINEQFINYGDRICSHFDGYSEVRERCKKAAKEETEDGYIVMFLFLWALSASFVGAVLEIQERKSGKF